MTVLRCLAAFAALLTLAACDTAPLETVPRVGALAAPEPAPLICANPDLLEIALERRDRVECEMSCEDLMVACLLEPIPCGTCSHEREQCVAACQL